MREQMSLANTAMNEADKRSGKRGKMPVNTKKGRARMKKGRDRMNEYSDRMGPKMMDENRNGVNAFKNMPMYDRMG
jgi:hypothetical protein